MSVKQHKTIWQKQRFADAYANFLRKRGYNVNQYPLQDGTWLVSYRK